MYNDASKYLKITPELCMELRIVRKNRVRHTFPHFLAEIMLIIQPYASTLPTI